MYHNNIYIIHAFVTTILHDISAKVVKATSSLNGPKPTDVAAEIAN